MAQVQIGNNSARLDGEHNQLLNDVKIILKDATGKPPGTKETVIKCLQYVKDHFYQCNGADVKPSLEKPPDNSYTPF